MKILHRYIMRTILSASTIVIFAVLGLTFFFGLLAELGDIGTGDYGIVQALMYVILKLPHDFYQFFPMLVLLGGVLGLGMLSSNHELLVMRTSGVSIKKLILAVLSAAVILVMVATLLGEGVAPRAMYLADKQKSSAQNEGQAVATASGVWVHEGNNFIHIDRVVGKRHLEGVKRYEFDGQHHLLNAYYAKALDFQNGKWLLHDLVKTTFKQDQTSSKVITNGVWDFALNPSLVSVGLVEPEELSLGMLSTYSHHLVENGLQAQRFQFEFWKRIFQPLTTLVMIVLAIPFVFARPPSVTIGWRIVFGVLIGFVFYILNSFLGQFSVVYQISPVVAAMLPTLLFAAGGYAFMLKLQR